MEIKLSSNNNKYFESDLSMEGLTERLILLTNKSIAELESFALRDKDTTNLPDAFRFFSLKWTANDPLYRFSRDEILEHIIKDDKYPMIAQELSYKYCPEIMDKILSNSSLQ